MATKTTNITGADLISFIDGCAPNQNQSGQTNLDAQSKNRLKSVSPQSRRPSDRLKITESPSASAKRISQNNAGITEEYKNSSQSAENHRPKTVYLSAETRIDWTKLFDDWAIVEVAFRALSRIWRRNIWNLIKMKLNSGKRYKTCCVPSLTIELAKQSKIRISNRMFRLACKTSVCSHKLHLAPLRAGTKKTTITTFSSVRLDVIFISKNKK